MPLPRIPSQPYLLVGSESSTGTNKIYIINTITLKKLNCKFIVTEPISFTNFPVKYINVINNKRPITLINIPQRLVSDDSSKIRMPRPNRTPMILNH